MLWHSFYSCNEILLIVIKTCKIKFVMDVYYNLGASKVFSCYHMAFSNKPVIVFLVI